MLFFIPSQPLPIRLLIKSILAKNGGEQETGLTIPLHAFTQTEVELLQSEQDQLILRTVLRLLLGKQQLGEDIFLTSDSHTTHHSNGHLLHKEQQKQGKSSSKRGTQSIDYRNK